MGTVLYPEEKVAHVGSIGRNAMPGVDLRVVREDGKDAVRGESGEIWMRADSMMSGYLNDESATKAAFAERRWYRTGDWARLDNDGYLFIVDRLKDMIITGGENVYSKEVEDALAQHPSIADVAVFAVPHETWGETVAAEIVTKPSETLTLEAVRRYLEGRLARYKIPRLVYFSERLPLTPAGKVQKFVLREMRRSETESDDLRALVTSRANCSPVGHPFRKHAENYGKHVSHFIPKRLTYDKFMHR